MTIMHNKNSEICAGNSARWRRSLSESVMVIMVDS